MFMQNLDSTVIATALPTIARSLDESPLTLNVAITCYLLSLAVFIPISGWTADRFGARRVFSAAIVVFTLGSIGCGMANSLAALVAARIIQGMGGALMVPVGRLVLLRTVEKSDLLAFYEGKVAKWWVPDDVAFVDAIPLGATGKMLKTRLRDSFRDYRLPTA